jgi:hypothetical protein
VPLNEARRPRSGVGLNDLLGRTEGRVRTRQGEQGRQSAHAAEAKPVGAQQSEAGNSDNPVPPAPIARNCKMRAAPCRSEQATNHDKRRNGYPKNTRGKTHPSAGLLNQLALMRPNA